MASQFLVDLTAASRELSKKGQKTAQVSDTPAAGEMTAAKTPPDGEMFGQLVAAQVTKVATALPPEASVEAEGVSMEGESEIPMAVPTPDLPDKTSVPDAPLPAAKAEPAVSSPRVVEVRPKEGDAPDTAPPQHADETGFPALDSSQSPVARETGVEAPPPTSAPAPTAVPDPRQSPRLEEPKQAAAPEPEMRIRPSAPSDLPETVAAAPSQPAETPVDDTAAGLAEAPLQKLVEEQAPGPDVSQPQQRRPETIFEALPLAAAPAVAPVTRAQVVDVPLQKRTGPVPDAEPAPSPAGPKQKVLATQPVMTNATAPIVSEAPSGLIQASDLVVPRGPEMTLAERPGNPVIAQPVAQAPVDRPVAAATLQSTAIQIGEVVLKQPNGPVEIALNPEELGRLRMVVSQNDLGLRLVISAERTETLDMLRRNIDQLSDDLRKLGYGDASFEFSGQFSRGSERQETLAACILEQRGAGPGQGADISGAPQTPLNRGPSAPFSDNGLDMRF